ncbi:MAG: sensor histidine kinase [Nitrospinota bacterium]
MRRRKLTLASRVVEQDGRRWWEARVADTGEGISEEIMGRIFDPFFATKEPDKGTGLGLSVSLGIVENRGGKIWAENAAGGGTTFTIRLPFEDKRGLVSALT